MSHGTFSDWLIVVPARLRSQRLENKPLQLLGGRPLVTRVFENLAPLEQEGATIVVAADDKEVEAACAAHKIPCVMTSVNHLSGTDRCNEAARGFGKPFVMNVQGDEPFVDLADLRCLAHSFQSSKAEMGTLGYQVRDDALYQNPNVVKIVMGSNQRALYFSRAPVPYDREAIRLSQPTRAFWQHIGVYCFRKETLASFCSLTASSLEHIEKLEQLRAIEAGWTIHVAEARHTSHGIDTQDDLARAEILWNRR